MALSKDGLDAFQEVAESVAKTVFPDLPVEAAFTLMGELFGKPVEEITDAELDAHMIERLRQQRANLR